MPVGAFCVFVSACRKDTSNPLRIGGKKQQVYSGGHSGHKRPDACSAQANKPVRVAEKVSRNPGQADPLAGPLDSHPGPQALTGTARATVTATEYAWNRR
jgi:hypothetical protein